MRSLKGLFWALGGGVAGMVVGLIAGIVITNVTSTTSREGAAGYLMVAIALIGALIGVVAGILLYGRSAPSGQAAAFAGSSLLGAIGVVAAVALGVWAFMSLREAPATYNGAMADLLLELRVKSADAPAADSTGWLDVEVQTPSTRPEGTVLWSQARTDGVFRIIPVTQGPLSRTGSRFIVVRVEGRQVEMFSPPMKRVPDPRAAWSPWYPANSVEPPYGVVPATPLRPLFELRYRIRVYGQ